MSATVTHTWTLTPATFSEIDDAVDRDGIYAKGYWETVDSQLQITGLRIGHGEDRIVAKFGDTIHRHANATYSVTPAPRCRFCGATEGQPSDFCADGCTFPASA